MTGTSGQKGVLRSTVTEQYDSSKSIRRDDPLPLYHQLKQILLEQIETGKLGTGDALPTEKELQERYDVSRITVRRALSDLAAAGYLVRLSGRGTFVLQPKVLHTSGRIGGFIDDLTEQGFRVRSEILVNERRPVPFSIAQKLNVPEGKELPYRKALVFASGAPIALGETYDNLGPAFSITPDELRNTSFLTVLAEKHGLVFRHAERTTEAVAARADEAEFLDVGIGAPLLLVELLIQDSDDKPVYFVKSLYRGDRYKYFQRIKT